MRRLVSRLARCVLALGLLLGVAGCGGGPDREPVTIMIPWSGDEFKAFYAVVTSFEKDTGIHVDVQVTRALTQQLDAAVAAGAPPDLAMLPSVGAIYRYADDTDGRRGPLQSLDVDTGGYLQPFGGLAKVGNKVYAVPVKVDVKSLAWFRPDSPLRPESPADLTALSGRYPGIWCLGLESGPTSGWPGADWIADILLAQQNADAYKRWVHGDLAWNSEPVRTAWSTWRDTVGVSVKGAASRSFGQAAANIPTKDVTAKAATCSLAHGALSAMGFKEGQRYAYVESSPTRRLEVSADFVGMFTDSNPSAERFIQYLAETKAQQTWVNQSEGFALSADSRVKYDNATQRRIAELLDRPGYTLCFGAADAMTPDVSAAFYRAVLKYATGSEDDLTDLLEGLDQVQTRLKGRSPVPPAELCATPR